MVHPPAPRWVPSNELQHFLSIALVSSICETREVFGIRIQFLQRIFNYVLETLLV